MASRSSSAFEFDPVKSAVNKAKHGIDFVAAQALWKDSRLATLLAQVHEEVRWQSVGMIDGKHWSAVYVWRDGRIRLISVWRARRKEVGIYESGRV